MTSDLTATDELLFERQDHVAILTMNRPERLNAISGPMLAALSARLTECQRNPEVRAVILTGAGRGFCSGLDLVDQRERMQANADGEGAGYSLFDLRDSPPMVLYRMDKPVICALNGAAAGYSMDLALLCDIRIQRPRQAGRGLRPPWRAPGERRHLAAAAPDRLASGRGGCLSRPRP